MVICNAPDEQRLLLALRQQPEQGLAAAIEQYGGLVQAVIRRTLGAARPQDVEECTSEVFWRFYQNAANFQPGRSLKSYLCGIARHVAIDRLRQLGRTDWLQLPRTKMRWAFGLTRLMSWPRLTGNSWCSNVWTPCRSQTVIFLSCAIILASALTLSPADWGWRLRLWKTVCIRGGCG